MHISIPKVYDAIVIGSGITGGWAAKELTEQGLEVLLLERGSNEIPQVLHKDEAKTTWFKPQENQAPFSEDDYPIQQKCYLFRPETAGYFVNDKRHPYLSPETSPFWWIRGYLLGGRSLSWALQCYRWNNNDFEANVLDGHGIDWAIRYPDVQKWYDYVESFVGISGQKEDWAEIPDGVFLSGMSLNAAEQHFRQCIARDFGRKMTVGRVAFRLFGQEKPTTAWGYDRNAYGKVFSSLNATLPAAFATGRLTIRTDSIVQSIEYDEAEGKATGVVVVDANTKEQHVFKAKTIFSCASTLGTLQLMLNSTSRAFPTGIANSSGALGHYLMDHHFQVGATARFPHLNHLPYVNTHPNNGIYLARFRNVNNENEGEFLRGYAYQGGAYRVDEGKGDWEINLHGFGEMLPRYENHATLHPTLTDEWGIPLLEIKVQMSDNELKMREDMRLQALEMLEKAGGTDLSSFEARAIPGHAIHEMGGAPMGNDPETSVLNAFNQCHDVPNLYVTDGACMNSTAAQNPSITYMALTARACHYAVANMKK